MMHKHHAVSSYISHSNLFFRFFHNLDFFFLNSNYCLGFKFFSPMKIFFDRKKLSVIYKKKWNCFFLCNFKTCRILWTVFVVLRFSWWIPHLLIGRIGIHPYSGKQKRVFLGLEVTDLLSRKPDNCIHTWWFRSISCRCHVLFY